jgi:hypothetical protein
MEIPFEDFIKKNNLNPDLLRLLNYKPTYNNPYEKRLTWMIDYIQLVKEDYDNVNDINNAIIRNENRNKENLINKIIPIEKFIFPNILEGVLYATYSDYNILFPEQKISLLNTFTHSIRQLINSAKELVNYRDKYLLFEKDRFIIKNELQIMIFLWIIHTALNINIKVNNYIINNPKYNAWIETKITDENFEIIKGLTKDLIVNDCKVFVIPTKKNKVNEIVEFCKSFGIDTKGKTKDELLKLI